MQPAIFNGIAAGPHVDGVCPPGGQNRLFIDNGLSHGSINNFILPHDIQYNQN
jgi:hypothetical protein